MKKPYIIAEIGINYQGKISLLKKMILSAKKAGADAVKFQLFEAKTLGNIASKKKYFFLSKDKKETLYQSWKRFELSNEKIKTIEKLAKKNKIDLIFSIFDFKSLQKVKKLKLKYIKIASSDVTDLVLLKEISKSKKPIILSTGMSNQREIKEALNTLEKNKVILLHCVSIYPCELKKINLNRMKTLSKVFKKEVGFSDHTKGIEASILAINQGAIYIEKHFTLNKKLLGPDHILSADETDLKYICSYAKNYKIMLGTGKISPNKDELKIKKIANKSIYLKKDVKKNQKLNINDIDIRRPAGFFFPKDLFKIVGKKLVKDLKIGTNLTKNHFI